MKSDNLPGRMIRTVAKNRMRQISSDPTRTSMSHVSASGGTAEHFASSSGGAARYLPGHAPSLGRQAAGIISSPLTKRSSLEDGGGGGGMMVSLVGGYPGRGLTKRRTSENSVESSREDCMMESDTDSVGLEESGEATPSSSLSCDTRIGDKPLQL